MLVEDAEYSASICCVLLVDHCGLAAAIGHRRDWGYLSSGKRFHPQLYPLCRLKSQEFGRGWKAEAAKQRLHGLQAALGGERNLKLGGGGETW